MQAVDLGQEDIHTYLARHQKKELLRLLTCGSVDDGKSTLIGRLLHDTKMIYEDQLAAVKRDSEKVGTTGAGEIDLALLTDGLKAEREQGITIDVAYRYFSTDRRKFIIADTPGHEQYTRNMATGASTCQLAIILIDARHGVMTQTRRHSFIVSLLGIRHVVVAINKMDLVGYSRDVFERIKDDYTGFVAKLDLRDITFIPMSALKGDNVVSRSDAMPWYPGPPLLDHLETVHIASDRNLADLRFPVQYVIRPNLDFRGFAGTVASGILRKGDEVMVLPSGKRSRVKSIVTYDGELEEAFAPHAVTLTLADEVDVSRGDVLAAAADAPEVADQFEATIVWMSEDPLLRGRSYLMRLGPKLATATVAPLKYKVNVNSLEHVAATKLELNEIGVCALELDRPIAFEPYERSREGGGFILIDRITNDTVGAGMIRFALRRSHNIAWQAVDVDKAARAAQKGQTPFVLWLTGLSGAGKSTIANLVEKKLVARGCHTYLLDGDNVRHGLNKDLGFTQGDRVENVRRVAEVARLMTDAGLIVLVSFISPFRSERRMARELFGEGEFLEVFVDTPLEIDEERDPKGLYAKARAGDLANFTGIDSPYEPPEHAEVRLDTTSLSAEESAAQVVAELESRSMLPGS
jgi:bifunctional enzyme CysN/CysC